MPDLTQFCLYTPQTTRGSANLYYRVS